MPGSGSYGGGGGLGHGGYGSGHGSYGGTGLDNNPDSSNHRSNSDDCTINAYCFYLFYCPLVGIPFVVLLFLLLPILLPILEIASCLGCKTAIKTCDTALDYVLFPHRRLRECCCPDTRDDEESVLGEKEGDYTI